MIKKIYALASILTLLIVLVFATSPLSARAQSNGWDFIKISPESGNWNYPGQFVLEAEQAVTVSWLIKCTYGGCNRPEEKVNNYTFAAGEVIKVGWGHQCYAWQFDTIGAAGYIAEAETSQCAPAPSPTVPATATSVPPTEVPTATPITSAVPPDITTATPTITDTVPTTPPATPPSPSATPIGIVATPTQTQPPTATTPPQPENKEDVVLPVTGQGPTASPLSSPLWPALIALLMLVLSGRMVWSGILQTEKAQIPSNLSPALRSQARKILILIVLSLLILATLVLPSIIHQAVLDFGEPRSSIPQPPAIVQMAPPNFSSALVAGQPARESRTGLQALDEQLSKSSQRLSTSSDEKLPVLAPTQANQAVNQVDTGPVTRLVIPALKVDSKVQYIPFEDHTWNIEKLGMDIAWLGNTSSPGLGGNTVLAGHITVLYLGNGPFRHLYSLKSGDLVYVYTYKNIYTYSVREQAVIKTDDSSVVGPTDQPQLTLLTCTGWDDETLRYTKRRAVFADLVSVAPTPYHRTGDWSIGN